MLKAAIAQLAWNAQVATYQVHEKADAGAAPDPMDFEGKAWQSWLAERSSFAFQSRGGQRFTARKETRARGSGYWVAYRKMGGKLTHTYIGRQEDVTLERLEQAAAFLAGQTGQGANKPPAPEQQIRQKPPASTGWQVQYLSTKFFVPVAPHPLITRPRLFSLLDESKGRPLTLVSAPAGFGKTTLLSSWVQTLPAGNPLVAWVSLDEADTDPIRFWSYVLTALDRVRPGNYGKLATYVRAEAQPSLPSVTTACLNHLSKEPNPIILVLDDYHLLTEEAVHTSLAAFIERLPPQVSMIISTRADPPLPLTRLRGRGKLLEVRADQLRTTPQEARAFLSEVMHIELPEQELTAVEERTEGWLVGLQLVGLSLQGRRSSALAGDLFEEVSGQQSYILDYLTEEVLSRQEPSIQRFLLHTSVLERLTAPLCDTLLGRSDSQQVLEALLRANLFVVSLDSQRRWYRFHALFAEALRSRLELAEDASVSELHLRASQWYAEQGHLAEAVQHALHASDWEHAADLIEHILPPMHWQRSEFLHVKRWLERLPTDVIRSRPRLCFAYAGALYYTSPVGSATTWVEAAEAGLILQQTASVALAAEEQATLDDLRGELFTLRAWMGVLGGDGQEVRTLCQQALAHLSPANRLARLEVLFFQSIADVLLGDLEPATQKALAGAALAQEVGSVPKTLSHLAQTMLCLYHRGQFQEALHIAQRADQVGRMLGNLPLPMVSVVFLYQALILLEWNKLDEALSLARSIIELKEQTRFLLYDYSVYTAQLEVQLALGDLEAAALTLRQVEQLLATHSQDSWYYRTMFLTGPQVRFWLRRGETDRAARTLEERWHRGSKSSAAPLARAVEESALVRLRLAQGKPLEALSLLAPMLEEATNRQWGKHVIELLVLQALAQQMRREELTAIIVLAQAVRLAEPEGYIRSFVNEGAPMAALLASLRERERKRGPTPYLDRVLAAFSSQTRADHSTAQPLLLDPLSAREQEVLQLLAVGASNQEIAERLVITVDTVKRHVSNVLSKLGASNRTQAVNQARVLGLLSSERHRPPSGHTSSD